jgi:hypothetical protein
MAKDMFWTVTTFSIILVVLVLAFWPSSKGHVIAYDCRIAEISPDIPLEVKEACRKKELNK